jgi:hypothetical protein
MVYLQKGKKKLDVNYILWENCMILKNFFLGKQSYNGPCYRKKKSPGVNWTVVGEVETVKVW